MMSGLDYLERGTFKKLGGRTKITGSEVVDKDLHLNFENHKSLVPICFTPFLESLS